MTRRRPSAGLPPAAALAAALLASLVLVAGCALAPPATSPASPAGPVAAPGATPTAAPPAEPAPPPRPGIVVGRNDRMLIYRPAPGETLASIATQYLGSESRAWLLAEANPGSRAEPGVPLIVPLVPPNPGGVLPDRVQTVPILCYHRFGNGSSKMIVTPAAFEAQLAWLVLAGYHVVRLSDLEGFLSGTQALPRRSVVITIDDGYESVHRHAFPLLRKYGLPATLFAYTDFIGSGDALSWAQLQDMAASGLVDIQAHSKTHRNLIERRPGESDDRYRAALDTEMRVPRELLERRVPSARVRYLAYPFGDLSDAVLDSATRAGYQLAGTVIPGGNAFYAQPLALRRTMIFGDMSLETFKAKLQTSRGLGSP